MKYDFDHTLNHIENGAYRWAQPEGRTDILGMGTADMDYSCPPAVREANLKVAEENTFNYRAKSEEYYNSIIGLYKRLYDLDIKREWINNIPCTLAILRMLFDMIGKPGDYVLMQTPYFAPIRNCIEGADRKFLENPMTLVDGRYELDLVDFEEKIAKYKPSVFMMVNPQNPTGRVFTQAELEKMVDICEKHGVIIISDEVHCFITYDNHHHIPILKVSEKAQKISIQLFSLSKGYNMMSLPHAMTLIANPELQKRWLDYLFSYDFHYATNSFAIASVTAAAQYGDEWLQECTDYLKQNMEKFLYFAEESHLPIKPLRPEAGYLLWIDCRESGIAPEDLGQAFLDRAGISLNNGLDHGTDGSGFVRLNFAVTHRIMDEALVRIKAMFS